MQREPIRFGAVAASRARRSAAGFTHPVRSTREVASIAATMSELDAAFADFTRLDTGSAPNEAQSKSVPQNVRSTTQALISDIATQLESLDSQRRQLARLLETVDTNATV